MKISSLRQAVQAFRRNEQGAVLALVTMSLPVFIGLAVLAVDIARLENLHTSLQKGADSLALTGAAELDRKPDSITRANAAIANMVTNRHKFSTAGAGNIVVAGKRFLSSLPANDALALAGATVTTDPLLARYVEITVGTANFRTIFPASIVGGTNTATTNAKAVAGFKAAVCQFTPMFICNPWEGTGTSIFSAVNDPTQRRRQIKMQSGPGGTSQYFPGNYGWLDSPNFGTGTNGANALRDALAQVRPQTCYVQDGVSQRTGNIASADTAINTRFDLWSGPFNGKSDNPLYPPAQNVRKGWIAGKGKNAACNPSETSPNTNKLGRDSAFPDAGGRLGNGIWDFNAYWAANFGGVAPNGWSNASRPSRYEVYRYELANGLTNTSAVAGLAKGEKGTPACYSGGGLSDNPDRRVLYGAIIDCTGLNVHGNTGGPLVVTTFAKFFLTEPVATDGTIYAELSGLVQPGSVSTDVARDIVQIYR